MRRFKTKNLFEQVDYKLLASGQATAQQIADIIKNAVGTFNDDEAVMQSAIAAIKDKMQLAEIEKLLGSNLIWSKILQTIQICKISITTMMIFNLIDSLCALPYFHKHFLK